MTSAPTLRFEVEGAVAILTIDRPDVRNAIDLATARAIADAVDELDDRPELRAAVLTGAGGTFCSGMDLAGFRRGERPVIEGRGFAGLTQAPPRTPLVVAIEGYAIAGGFELALAGDLIVAGRGAKLGLPEVKRGLTPAAGGLFRLPARIPRHVALEMILTGEVITATRAHEVGLVNRVVDDGTARAAAVELANLIAANGPLAVQAAKRVVYASADWTEGESFERQEEHVDPVRRSNDAQEGAAAFLEKRPPVWTAT
jgi:enoyl-CoA hydratase